ncbi:tetratricopeptide repeat protein [Calothrix sp. CCY 0018]|uniref:tetratricopeptide repeat protein n=1 Tax=Calothrix sp. CCY 0018 TaxID=3103864 RepID=UPI0039C68459
MNQELLGKLAKAQTDEERSWIVTESLLSTLSPELAAAAWTVVVPHWFDAEILAALRPELQAQSSELYTELQALPFVEEFADRGHNIHDLTRNLMLNHLWQEHRDEFITLSQRAAEYFFSTNELQTAITDRPETQIERLYHLIVVDREWQGSEFWDVAENWHNNFRIAELESLVAVLLEHIETERVTISAKAEVYYWAGKTKFRVYEASAALKYYAAALESYREIGDRFGEANTLRAIGDVCQLSSSMDDLQQALQSYEAALTLYHDISISQAASLETLLGEANTLQSIGDILKHLDSYTEALGYYEAALVSYRDIGVSQAPLLKFRWEADTLRAIGDVLKFLKRRNEALERYKVALTLYREIGDRFGEANTLIAIGNALKFLKGSNEALERYEVALTLYREIGNPLWEAYTLKAIGDVLQFNKRSDEAMQNYEQSLALYRKISFPLGEANVLKAIGDIILKFFYRRSAEALERYEAALVIYREIGYRLEEAQTLKAIGDLLYTLKRHTEALERYEAALVIYREIGYRLWEAKTLTGIGDVLQSLKRSDEAMQKYEQALVLFREVSDSDGEGYTLKGIGDVLQSLKRSDEAMQKYEQALALYRVNGYRLGQERTLEAMARLNLQLGRFKEELVCLLKLVWVRIFMAFERN